MLMAKVSISESKKVAGSKIKNKMTLSRLVVRWQIFAKSLICLESWDFLGLDSLGLYAFGLDLRVDLGDLCVDFGIFEFLFFRFFAQF